MAHFTWSVEWDDVTPVRFRRAPRSTMILPVVSGIVRHRPKLGSRNWERAGGPPLSPEEQILELAGAVPLMLSHFGHQALRRLGLGTSVPAWVDLSAWQPPDSAIAREADAFLREVSSLQMVGHVYRSYLFAAALYELAPQKPPIDREALFVGAILHDVALCHPKLIQAGEGCFSVASAREARRIAAAAGWDEVRTDKAALVITSNLNASVPLATFGAEAHFMRAGGVVEVLAQEWAVHPDNLREILAQHPRRGFVEDVMPHLRAEEARHPRCRFATLEPMFSWVVQRSHFHSP